MRDLALTESCQKVEKRDDIEATSSCGLLEKAATFCALETQNP